MIRLIGSSGLGDAVRHGPRFLIDIAIVVVFLSIQARVWMSPLTNSADKVFDGMKTSFVAGLTVAGTLVPITLLSVSLATDTSARGHLSSPGLVDLVVASWWALLSIVAGCYGLYSICVKPTTGLGRRDVGVAYGAQLILLVVAIFRLTWGLATITSRLIATPN